MVITNVMAMTILKKRITPISKCLAPSFQMKMMTIVMTSTKMESLRRQDLLCKLMKTRQLRAIKRKHNTYHFYLPQRKKRARLRDSRSLPRE